MYEFIDAEYATCETAPAVRHMCEWLDVSKSGFREWRSRPQSAAARRREGLAALIRHVFGDSDGTYGYRRIAAQLARPGIAAGPELVRRIMRELGLVPCQPRPWRPATTIQGQAGPIPDLVNRDFTSDVPGQKMAGDITCIETWEGWAFLATVIGCATRKVIGWAIDDNYRTPLITAAIKMAARNLDLPPGAVFHSDRGSNYTSAEFGAVLAGLDIRQSAGRTGICYDKGLDSYCTSWGRSDARAGRRGCAHWIWAGSGRASSMMATGSSQCGQFPPIPTARPKVPQSGQRCWPSARLEQLSHS